MRPNHPFDWQRRMMREYLQVRELVDADFYPLTPCGTGSGRVVRLAVPPARDRARGGAALPAGALPPDHGSFPPGRRGPRRAIHVHRRGQRSAVDLRRGSAARGRAVSDHRETPGQLVIFYHRAKKAAPLTREAA